MQLRTKMKNTLTREGGEGRRCQFLSASNSSTKGPELTQNYLPQAPRDKGGLPQKMFQILGRQQHK